MRKPCKRAPPCVGRIGSPHPRQSGCPSRSSRLRRCGAAAILDTGRSPDQHLPGISRGPSLWPAPCFSCPLIRRRIWLHHLADALGLVDQLPGSGDRLRRVGFRLPGAFFPRGLDASMSMRLPKKRASSRRGNSFGHGSSSAVSAKELPSSPQRGAASGASPPTLDFAPRERACAPLSEGQVPSFAAAVEVIEVVRPEISETPGREGLRARRCRSPARGASGARAAEAPMRRGIPACPGLVRRV